MDDARWQRIKDLFGEAAELPTLLREGFLDEACEGEPELRAEVDSLLAHHGGAGAEGGAEPEAPAAVAEGPGTVIDRYRLLERIGEGGMGEVFMAEQLRPVKRQVALKIIKLGLDSSEVVARFEAERQALALMDHPHIAKVLDGGATEAGRPYFVMELVRGVPITEWCDAAALDTRGRLELFRKVCSAVQHAHTRGVIHRDIKPSNVLVTLHDGVPVPKVIDFGIAKAVDQELTERTCFTRFRQVVGTPECMAPEQAELSGLDVDARADIYSLGVLLYELLTGTKPFEAAELREKGYVEMLRTIREVDPPKPSTRLTSLGERLALVAGQRGAAAASLPRQLAGDLDWIVMRCLEKDRTRRYETASSLAADVGRHLADEPVEAGPPSALYRFGKLCRRRRGTMVAASLALVGLGLGFTAAAFSYNDMHREWESSLRDRELALAQREEAEAARRAANRELVRSERLGAFLANVVGGGMPSDPADADGQGEWTVEWSGPTPAVRSDGEYAFDVDVGSELDLAVVRANREFADDPELAARIHATLGRGYVTRGFFHKAVRFLPGSHAAAAAGLGEDDPHTLVLADELTEVFVQLGRTDDALANQQALVEVLRDSRGSDHPETVAAVGNLATVFLSAGRRDEAQRVVTEVYLTSDGGPQGPGAEELLLAAQVAAATRPGALAAARNAAAWALLTTPTPALRDPEAALVLARRACDATAHGDPLFLDTLSLALWRSGQAGEAAANQRAALALVPPMQTLLRADMDKALAVYEGRLDEDAWLAGLLVER